LGCETLIFPDVAEQSSVPVTTPAPQVRSVMPGMRRVAISSVAGDIVKSSPGF
jgi:hypothetical protein